MKTVRNNPCRPRRVYIEIVFTLLCKHLLQDGTLKCEQNSTSPLLDAAVLLGSDKQLEWGAVLRACSSCCHGLLPSTATSFASTKPGHALSLPSSSSSCSSSSQGSFPNLIQNLVCSGALKLPNFLRFSLPGVWAPPRSWVLMMFWLRWCLKSTRLFFALQPHVLFSFRFKLFLSHYKTVSSPCRCVCDLQWVIS